MTGETALARPPDSPLPEGMQRTILRRLRRLEGQARGVQRMVKEGRDCRDILHQIAAIQAAAHSLGTLVLEHYVLACLQQLPAFPGDGDAQAVVREAIQQMAR